MFIMVGSEPRWRNRCVLCVLYVPCVLCVLCVLCCARLRVGRCLRIRPCVPTVLCRNGHLQGSTSYYHSSSIVYCQALVWRSTERCNQYIKNSSLFYQDGVGDFDHDRGRLHYYWQRFYHSLDLRVLGWGRGYVVGAVESRAT